jgi:hypothetical protein
VAHTANEVFTQSARQSLDQRQLLPAGQLFDHLFDHVIAPLRDLAGSLTNNAGPGIPNHPNQSGHISGATRTRSR